MNQLFVAFILFSAISSIYGQTGRQESECEKHKVSATKSTSPVKIVPNCEANGDYSAKQCHANAKPKKQFCQCWNSTGHPKSSPSTKITRCDCILHREQVRESGGPRNPEGPIGAYVPQCAANGGYEKKQCNGSTGTCWCVDDSGTQINGNVATNCT